MLYLSKSWLIFFNLGILFFYLNGINAAINLSNLRIIRSFASSVTLQCPTSYYSEHIDLSCVRWINERYDFNKPDQNVVITPQNLILTSQLSLQLNPHYEYVSCGYITKTNQYVRLGFWKLTYIGKNNIY